MPIRGTDSAPKYDGSTENLIAFIDDFEDLADQAGLQGTDRIRGIIRYVPTSERELWSETPEAKGTDYGAFIKEVKRMYPGCEGDRRYAVADLQTIARNQASKSMYSVKELGDYQRAFLKVARALIDKDRIVKQEFVARRAGGYGPSGCIFCGGTDHYMGRCREKEAYITAGKCKVDTATNKLVLPNGGWIPGRQSDGTLKKCLDRHYANQAVNEALPGKNVRFDGVELESAPRAQVAKATNEATPKLAKAKEVAPVASSSSSTLPDANTANPSAASTSNQYRFSFALEDKGADKRVIERLLDSNIAIPVRELLAVSPEVRKNLRDLTTTKRVTVGSVLVNELVGQPSNDEWLREYDEERLRSSDGKIVADHCASLRCVRATTIGGRILTCVLDQDAEVVVMPKVVWKELGIGLRSDYRPNMESVNTSKDTTLGVVENVPLDFGGGPMYFQVQVTERANFEILLGRPFFKLTACRTFDLPDGEQDILLTDPNTRKELRIPTLPWRKPCPRCTKGMTCVEHSVHKEEGKGF
ncbi:hypothetical protein P692DRAFT_201731714 [Suillus brevipes Sb2]|nr:hypothetical protein P692DRAFT_201731714 [Suillus brevipes Sb2]